MSLGVHTNIHSILAQRALRLNTSSLASNIEHLATGSRINKASEDAAGNSISKKITTEILGLGKASQNVADAISAIQTAEASIGVIQENMQRVRELFVQGLNGTNGAVEKGALQREINKRIENILDIAEATEFNNKALIYNANDLVVQSGAKSGEIMTLKLATGNNPREGAQIDISYVSSNTSNDDFGQIVEETSTGFALDRIYIEGSNVNSLNYDVHASNFAANLDDLTQVIDNLSRMRSYFGAIQSGLEKKLDYISFADENAQLSRSKIQDTDIAKESALMAQKQILQQSSTAMIAQANAMPEIVLQLMPQ